MNDASQDLSSEQLAEIPPEHLTDKTVDLGHPDAHKHVWVSTGVIDEGGAHEVTCACGAEGSGYGPWSSAPVEESPAESPVVEESPGA